MVKKRIISLSVTQSGRNVTSRLRNMSLPLYLAVLRPDPECCMWFGALYHKEDTDIPQQVQWKPQCCTELWMDHMAFGEKLKELGQFILEKKRLRETLVLSATTYWEDTKTETASFLVRHRKNILP